jgi:hypothetical protein
VGLTLTYPEHPQLNHRSITILWDVLNHFYCHRMVVAAVQEAIAIPVGPLSVEALNHSTESAFPQLGQHFICKA